MTPEEKLQDKIDRGVARQNQLKGMLKMAGFVCLVGIIAPKVPPVLAVLAISAVAAIGIGTVFLVNEMLLNNRYKAQKEILKSQKREGSAPVSPAADQTSEFNTAARVADLETKVDELKKTVEGEPVTLERPKTDRPFFKRFGGR